MLFKTALEPQYRIPTPVLSILVGKLPKNVTTPAPKDDDPWEKEWSWGVDYESRNDKDTSDSSLSPSPVPSPDTHVSSSATIADPAANPADPVVPMPPIVKEAYLVSASAAGHTIVLAYSSKFVVLQLFADQGEYIVIGQSPLLSEDDTITSLLCLPLFIPSIRKIQIFVMVGYKSGWLRVFSSNGTLLTAQLLETSPLVSIKLRTPPPPSASGRKATPEQKFGAGTLATHHDDEDITLLFDNNHVVSIDGQTFWAVLRVCDGQRESGYDASKMRSSFSYKKWYLDQQEQINDVISLGPSMFNNRPVQDISRAWWSPLSGTPCEMDPSIASAVQWTFASPQKSNAGATQPTLSSALSSSPASTSIAPNNFTPCTATARYIAVGREPMIGFYATHETSRPFLSTVSMVSWAVSRVASPVFSLAKSWWSGQSIQDATSSSPPLYQQDMLEAPQAIEVATPLPCICRLSDTSRVIQSISVAPPYQHSQHHTLAATSDALGRVILWDIQRGYMVSMWKGMRDARCGWIQYQPSWLEKKNGSHRRSYLFLVIYSSRRGLLKIFRVRHGSTQQQVGVFHVGTGHRLVACEREPLGSSMASAERRKTAASQGEECGIPSCCLLIAPDGEVRKIAVYPVDPTNPSSQ
ncbi:hypothetical protein DM01DRAFT_1382443 [Hesseltinella vesiculosa]|uniref:Rab3-GAP regulatory subunit N-terminal domain-containing protein n=1 Tax=Hesseltinella vesiculosa TaxID=101127 RepID=A0A1X2GKI6_9FUNG|nr:hypothetical protein DM01DRAFT_1382443 [Hesseltinella vesiculosa]